MVDAATRPPPGSARVRTASVRNARLVRANGAEWTLVGWTVGPVLLLTDAVPGIAADISGEPPAAGTAGCPDRSR